MRSKASVAHDFLKVSRDLEEALARGAFSACELRIIAWLKARTYGVRVKKDEGWVALDAIPLTSTFLSSDTGLHRRRVREAVELLLNDFVLRRKANGWVGINSRLSDWKRARLGREFNFDAKPQVQKGQRTWDKVSPGQVVPGRGGQVVPGNRGQGVPGLQGQVVPGDAGPYKERARVETLEMERGEGNPPLPNGKNDTTTNRAEAGLADFPPQDHPAFRSLSFKIQDKMQERWEARLAEERKKTHCRKCQRVPRADNWPYCRGCTVCGECGARPDGKKVFSAIKNEIVCNGCKEKR
jgi:hypothetical protein